MIVPKRGFGQNFLQDPPTIKRIVDLLPTLSDSSVIEIGPGLGALTEHLSHARTLTLVEFDASLIANLQLRFKEAIILHADAQQVTFPVSRCIIGNLPYNVGSQILFNVFRQSEKFSMAVFMLQHEVVKRLAAGVGEELYNKLSVLTQIFAKINIKYHVSGSVFYPRPAVRSTVFTLTFLPLPVENRHHFFQFCLEHLKNFFIYPRKIIDQQLLSLHLQAFMFKSKVRAGEFNPNQWLEILLHLYLKAGYN